MIGDACELPSADILTSDGRHFKHQLMDPAHPNNFTGYHAANAYTWLLEGDGTGTCNSNPSSGKNIGCDSILFVLFVSCQKMVGPCSNSWIGPSRYFNLGATAPEGSLRLMDWRVYTMAAVIYYDRTGELVEDLTEDFKRTQVHLAGLTLYI